TARRAGCDECARAGRPRLCDRSWPSDQGGALDEPCGRPRNPRSLYGDCLMRTTPVDLLGEDEVVIEAALNGRPLQRAVKARRHLADCLRQEMELTGTHLGCEHGICGACTVLIDGRTARGCLTLVAQISGKKVDTIEGLAESGKLAKLQAEFIA